MLYYISKLSLAKVVFAKWPYRLAVRTAPSHGANSGSSPDKVTNESHPFRAAFFVGELIGKDEERDG